MLSAKSAERKKNAEILINQNDNACCIPFLNTRTPQNGDEDGIV